MYIKNNRKKTKFIKFKLHYSIMLFLILIFTMIIALILIFKLTMNDAEYSLPVFETADIHGNIVKKLDNNNYYYLAYISDKVKDIRGHDNNYVKDKALLLDAGDIYQGNIVSNFYNGSPMSVAYEYMDYDSVTIGNHEFDFEIENTVDKDGTMMDSNKIIKLENHVPIVASNLYYNSNKIDWIKDYIIVNKVAKNSFGKEIIVKVGIIGYLDDYGDYVTYNKFSGLGYSVEKNPNIPNEIAKKLENEGLADVTILLSHADANMTAESLGNNSVIDVVLGGHSHLKESGIASNGIFYMEPNENGDSYCYLELIFNIKNGKKLFFKTVKNMKIFSVDDYSNKTLKHQKNVRELDFKIVELTDKFINSSKIKILDNKIGYITKSAKSREFIDNSGGLSTTGGNWMSSIYKKISNSDVAFTNYGSVRHDFELSENSKINITIGDIFNNFPFNNHIYKYDITYKELLELLDISIKYDEYNFITSLVGIDCYFENNSINALVKDDVLIYNKGEWKDDWENKHLTISTNEFIATKEKIFGAITNPLVQYNKTSKLLEYDKIDSINAVKVLTHEAAKNNGLIDVDTKAHFIKGIYK